MKSQVWLLSVSFLLVCGTIGCGEKPEPVVQEPQPVVQEPQPVVQEPQPVVQEPKTAVEGPDAVVSKPDVTEEPEYVKEGSGYAASYVSWEDAVEFCKRLSAKDGATYRLPTEAEWEYACRGGTTTAYQSGDASVRLADYAWFRDNTSAVGEYYAHEVGQKKPNGFGLYDMHGSVWEWCSDWYDKGYFVGSPEADPAGPPGGSRRVSRGGSWGAKARFCRSAYRSGSPPSYRSLSMGFRVACSPSGQ